MSEPGLPLLCGVDIGGSKLAVGLVTPSGEVPHLRTVTSHRGLREADLLDLVRDLVGDLCREAGFPLARLIGTAVGMAGYMRSRDGVVITTANLPGFKNYPLAAELSRRLDGTLVTLENDANCQAWAEFKFGAGQGHNDMVFVTVSTGIGAGLILNGHLYRGRTGTAGEVGHTIVQADSDSICNCGNRGCFAAHASTMNLDYLVAKKRASHPESSLFAGNPGSAARRVDGRLVYSLARGGDVLAREIIDEYADYLGILIYNIFQFINPSAIVLGGGLMNWELGFFERMLAKFHVLARDMLFDPLLIVKAGIADGSGVIGAATLLLDR